MQMILGWKTALIADQFHRHFILSDGQNIESGVWGQ